MAVLLVVVLCLIGLAVLAVIYWKWMLATCTDSTRADEVHMVTTEDLWRVRLCRYKPKTGEGEPVFLCHGFMANQFNFCYPAGASVVDVLVEQGYDCWAIDLRGARSSIPPFGRSIEEPTVDDYLLRDIPAALDYIRRNTRYAKVHWIGHSMGGMLLYAYDAVFGPDVVSSATTAGSPIGFEGMAFRRPNLLFALRRCSRGLWDAVTRGSMPLLNVIRPQSQTVPINWENMNPALGVKQFFNMLETPPMEVAETLAKAAEFKVWRVRNDEVDVFAALKELRVPLFAIFGQADPMVAAGTVQEFFDALPGADKKLLLLSKENGHEADYSHVDLVMGRRCDVEVFPALIAWLQDHPISERLGQEKAVAAKPAKKRVAKKPAAKKTVAKKPAAKKPAAKKTVAKKKRVAKKTVAKKPAAKKPAAKKTVAKKPAAKKPAAKKPAAERSARVAAAARQAAAAIEGAPAKKKPTAKKRSPKKAAAKKPVAKKKAAAKKRATA